MQADKDHGYNVTRRKCKGIISVLRDISTLIGETKETWVKLETGDQIMPGVGLLNEAIHLTNCIKYLQQGIFRVSVLGSYKTGKSTLINALLGSKLLPALPQPTTAVVTHVLCGEHEEVMIYEEGKSQLYPVSWEVFRENFTLSKADISTLDAQGRIDSQLKHIYYAQVESQHPLLTNGVHLIDTPGLGVSIARPLVTPGSLKRSDSAILFVLNAVKPFPKDVQTFLATVIGSKRRDNFFFVINRIDQLPPERIELLKREVRQMLRQYFIDENHAFDYALYTCRVFFVSAKEALEARLADPENTARLEASGIPVLEQELENFFTSSGCFSQAIEPVLQLLKHTADKAHQQITESKAALQSAGKQHKRLSVVRETMRLDTIERKLQELVEKANRIIVDRRVTEKSGLLPTITSGPLLDQSGALKDWVTPDDFDIDDHLHFLGRLIERVDLPPSVSQEVRERINEIFYRYTDPSLYLAVVGEFSSGKSTFINALLRQDLLKTSVLVTTTTSTRIRYGPVPNVEVLFKKQREPISYRKDAQRLWRLIRFFAQQETEQSGTFQEYLHVLTAEDRVAAQIDYLVISHPAPFLSDGIVIVDTPGTNADNERHAQITAHLIQQEADAAVIIIPAPFPLQKTLSEFLTEHLRKYLHRCLFVVTQMDKIPVPQQPLVLHHIHSRLSELAIEQPVLYEAAPQIVLDLLGGTETVAPGLQHWGGKFYELEETIWERLHRERTLSIAERLTRLLTSLFEQLDQYLRTHQSEQTLSLQTDLNELERRRKALGERQQL